MLAKFSYLAFGFFIGAGLLIGITSFTMHDGPLQKTGRLSGAIAPTDFQMDRFG